MRGVTTRLHWTDKPYKWHVNDGEEVFAVLNGRVEMRFREDGKEQSVVLETGDHNFPDQSLGQPANFRVNGHGGSEGTATATNHDFVVIVFQIILWPHCLMATASVSTQVVVC